MDQLTPHETWTITDSTKLTTYAECPRKYFYIYILGWRPDVPSIHLAYGSAFHIAMEHILRNKEKCGSSDVVSEAFDLFLAAYRENFPEEVDEENSPKNPDRTFDALIKYVKKVKDEPWDVLYTEVAGTVIVSPEQSIHFKIDAICRDKDHVWTYDHKTTKYDGAAARAQYDLSIQTGTYTHALYCLYPPEEVFGHRINMVILRNAPKLKKDGLPYAGAKDTEIVEIPIRKTPDHMAQWQWNTLYLMQMLQWDMNNLSKTDGDDIVLRAFAQNPTNCTKYGLCPYHAFCCAWPNPLHHCTEPPPGYKIEFWDPRSQAEEARYTLTEEKGLEEKK